ncbi:hypothetical protein SATRM34S_03752 [Streptomyces atroolivaceus]
MTVKREPSTAHSTGPYGQHLADVQQPPPHDQHPPGPGGVRLRLDAHGGLEVQPGHAEPAGVDIEEEPAEDGDG